MIYYRIRQPLDGKDSILVLDSMRGNRALYARYYVNELLTEKELHQAQIPECYRELVTISKRQTYIAYGRRFAKEINTKGGEQSELSETN